MEIAVNGSYIILNDGNDARQLKKFIEMKFGIGKMNDGRISGSKFLIQIRDDNKFILKCVDAFGVIEKSLISRMSRPRNDISLKNPFILPKSINDLKIYNLNNYLFNSIEFIRLDDKISKLFGIEVSNSNSFNDNSDDGLQEGDSSDVSNRIDNYVDDEDYLFIKFNEFHDLKSNSPLPLNDNKFILINKLDNLILGSTLLRWICQLTSEFLYDELNLFLDCYQSFLSPKSLLMLLIKRFKWSIMNRNDIPNLTLFNTVKVRTFVMLRMWLTNYYKRDFQHSYSLNVNFKKQLNKLKIDLKDDNNTNSTIGLIDKLLKILQKLEEVYNIDNEDVINNDNHISSHSNNSTYHKYDSEYSIVNQFKNFKNKSKNLLKFKITSDDDYFEGNNEILISSNNSVSESINDNNDHNDNKDVNNENLEEIENFYSTIKFNGNLSDFLNLQGINFNKFENVYQLDDLDSDFDDDESSNENTNDKNNNNNNNNNENDNVNDFQNWQNNFTIEGLESDDENEGDVDAALKALEGQIDNVKKVQKLRKVESMMEKSKKKSIKNNVNNKAGTKSLILNENNNNKNEVQLQRHSLSKSSLINYKLKSFKSSWILNFKTEIIAQQFTLIERDLFNELSYKDLLNINNFKFEYHSCDETILAWINFMKDHARRKVSSNDNDNEYEGSSVRCIISRFNLTVRWTVNEILLNVSTNYKITIISKFIKLAFKCQQKGNYMTSYAILKGFEHKVVKFMYNVWPQISKQNIRILNTLKEFFNSNDNYSTLRQNLTNILNHNLLNVNEFYDNDYHNFNHDDSHSPILNNSNNSSFISHSKRSSSSTNFIFNNGNNNTNDYNQLSSPSFNNNNNNVNNMGCIPFIGIFLIDLNEALSLPDFISTQSSRDSNISLINVHKLRLLNNVKRSLE